MADLIDRLSGVSQPTRPRLAVHQFVGGLRLYADGLVTRSELVNNWDLQGDEATEAGQVADVIDAAVGITNKLNYILRFEAISMLIEDRQDTIYHVTGTVNKSKVRTDAGLL